MVSNAKIAKLWSMKTVNFIVNVSCVLGAWYLYSTYQLSARGIREILGIDYEAVDSMSVLNLENVLARNPNWRTLLEIPRVPFECLRMGGVEPSGLCP